MLITNWAEEVEIRLAVFKGSLRPQLFQQVIVSEFISGSVEDILKRNKIIVN